jgi:4-aminobutyrate aminotransferase
MEGASAKNAKWPEIKTSLPGPRAAQVLAQDWQWMSQGGHRPYRFVMRDGEGCWVRDVDDNLYLDFTSGIGVLPAGHSPPRVVEAMRKQAEAFLHVSSAYHAYDVMTSLAERVARSMALKEPARVFFGNSGTEAIEGAIKLARWYTRRPYLLSFFSAFHGRTYGAASLSALSAEPRRRIGPLLPGVFHLPYADEDRGVTTQEVLARANELFERVVPAEEVAAVVVEAIQGGGAPVTIPDANFLPMLRELADRHGFLLIIDEVFTGVGRTGEMWAHKHWDVRPDIVCFAKSIASGMPLSGFVAGGGIMEWPRGTHNSTFGGNPVSCAAAHATLDLVEEGLVENSRVKGKDLLAELIRLSHLFPKTISRVIGKGLMLYVELVTQEAAQNTLETAFSNGLLLLAAGRSGIRLAPPLIVNGHEAHVAIELLTRTIDEIASRNDPR